MPDAWELVPFGRDSWPTRERWQVAGELTLWDRVELGRWAAQAELELRLEIDRRFDELADRVLGSAWAGLVD